MIAIVQDLAASLLRSLHRAMDEQLDGLVASGYRGPLYAWYDDSMTLRVDTVVPVGQHGVQAIEITDEAVAAYLAHRRGEAH